MIDDNRAYEVDLALRHNLGCPEEIKLYEELSLALELMEDDKFYVSSSGIGGGIDFVINIPYPDGLPEKVGALFFNISNKFDVKIKEISESAYSVERKFAVKIKKL